MARADESGDGFVKPSKGIVALLDYLGTKGILATRPARSVVRDWLELVDNIAAQVDQLAKGLDAHVISLSDTIVVTLAGAEAKELLKVMTDCLAGPFFEAFSKGIFLRGAMSYGWFYQEDTRIIGPAIDEAAAWYEVTDWLGLSATPSVEQYLRILQAQGEELPEFLGEWLVPLADGSHKSSRDGWGFLWPQAVLQGRTLGSAELLRVVLEGFIQYSGGVSPGIVYKYDNTLKFLEASLTNWDETAGSVPLTGVRT